MIRKLKFKSFGENNPKTHYCINRMISFNEMSQAKENEIEALNFGYKTEKTFNKIRENYTVKDKFILVINSKEKKAIWTSFDYYLFELI